LQRRTRIFSLISFSKLRYFCTSCDGDIPIEYPQSRSTAQASGLNSTIKGYLEAQQLNLAVKTLHQFEKKGFPPDESTYRSFIDFFINNGQSNKAEEWLHRMNLNGIVASRTTIHKLIEGYLRAGCFVTSSEQMKDYRTTYPSVISFNTFVDFLSLQRETPTNIVQRYNEGLLPIGTTVSALLTFDYDVFNYACAFHLLKEMRNYSGGNPNVESYSIFIRHFAFIKKDMEKAQEWFHYMQKNCITPTEESMDTLITGYLNVGDFPRAYQIFTGMEAACGVCPSERIFLRFLFYFVERGSMDMAEKWFQTIPQLNTLAFNIMLSGFVKYNNFSRGENYYRKMESLGIPPDEMTHKLVTILLRNNLASNKK